MAKTKQALHNEAITAIAEEAFREALRGGDTAKDAWDYAQAMVRSAELAAG